VFPEGAYDQQRMYIVLSVALVAVPNVYSRYGAVVVAAGEVSNESGIQPVLA
jgi:hypothetical protein